MSPMSFCPNRLPNHRCHDYPELIRQWRALCREAGLVMRELCRVDGLRVHWLESKAARRGDPAIYLSAGVHGDEPGATAGLLAWAGQNLERLKRESFVIFPCLNPHGLLLNTRVDQRGLDLNRRFHLDDDPVCGAWRRVLTGRALRLAICLHEDYDAHGIYVYELSRLEGGWSRTLLRQCMDATLPVDSRAKIEGRAAHGGVIQRKKSPRGLPGLPEAVAIYELGCPVSLTFETPSEFALDDRVRAQARFLDAALHLQPEAMMP